MERLTNINNPKKNKFTKKKLFIIIAIIIIILIGILFLINRLIPIKDISKDNINIKLSTIKPTGQNVTATVTTKTKYDIFYFIDYSAGEEQYYEDQDLSQEVQEISDLDLSNTLNTSNSIANDNTSNTSNITNTSNVSNTSNTTNTINNSIDNTSPIDTDKKLDIKQISDNEYKKVTSSKFEIENNGIVYLKYGRFGKLSSIPYVFEVSNIDKTGPEIGEIETTSTYNSITVIASAIDENPDNLQYYFKLSDSENYICTGSKNNYTFKDLTPNESYTIFIKVSDQFGNESESVTDATASIESETEDDEKIVQQVYHFKVNLGANTVTVYEKDENGKFTKPVKAFICSTGKATPKSGTYKISNKYRWRSLFGNVYGQYAVRITGNILFHSVPYEKMYPNTLEYDEYDKLGTSASMGCIRLCVRDAKWIYDNAKAGSTVEFYSNASNPGPLGKPKSQKISSNKANRNWDPTDPDKHNPWFGGDGKVSKPNISEEEYFVNNTTINNTVNTTNTISNSITNRIDNSIPKNTINNTTTNSYTNEQSQNYTNQTENQNTVSPPTNTVDVPNSSSGQNTVDSDEQSSNIVTNSSSVNPSNEGNTPEPPISNTTSSIEIEN